MSEYIYLSGTEAVSNSLIILSVVLVTNISSKVNMTSHEDYGTVTCSTWGENTIKTNLVKRYRLKFLKPEVFPTNSGTVSFRRGALQLDFPITIYPTNTGNFNLHD